MYSFVNGGELRSTALLLLVEGATETDVPPRWNGGRGSNSRGSGAGAVERLEGRLEVDELRPGPCADDPVYVAGGRAVGPCTKAV